jgi:ABC-type transporter Mla MlaB component
MVARLCDDDRSRRPAGAPDASGRPATGIIRLAGDLREGSALNEVQQRCLELVRPLPRRVIVDCEHITEADSKLVGLLLLILRHARQVGVHLDITVSPHVRDWISLFGIERLLWPGSARGRPQALMTSCEKVEYPCTACRINQQAEGEPRTGFRASRIGGTDVR